MKIYHERHASPIGVLGGIQRQVITPTPNLCMKRSQKNKQLCKWEMQYNIKIEVRQQTHQNTELTRAWLEAWSTTATDIDVLVSVSSKATSIFSWRHKGTLLDFVITCHYGKQE